jgi:hypothetical protein
MDVNTGKLYKENDLKELLEKNLIQVQGKLTGKQEKEMKVSLNDHKSEVGKQLTQERANQNITKNKIRKLKRKGLLK